MKLWQLFHKGYILSACWLCWLELHGVCTVEVWFGHPLFWFIERPPTLELPPFEEMSMQLACANFFGFGFMIDNYSLPPFIVFSCLLWKVSLLVERLCVALGSLLIIQCTCVPTISLSVCVLPTCIFSLPFTFFNLRNGIFAVFFLYLRGLYLELNVQWSVCSTMCFVSFHHCSC